MFEEKPGFPAEAGYTQIYEQIVFSIGKNSPPYLLGAKANYTLPQLNMSLAKQINYVKGKSKNFKSNDLLFGH